MSNESINTKSPEQGNAESLKDLKTAERPKGGEYSQAEQEQQVEKAQAAVTAEVSTIERPSLPPVIDERPQLIDNIAKTLRMHRNLRSLQSKLKPAEKSFSKVIHQPLVSKISESASKTVARPSGILGGGIVAFIGCVGYQILARYYGLPYNFSFFILFFVSGFGLGLLGELAIRKFKH